MSGSKVLVGTISAIVFGSGSAVLGARVIENVNEVPKYQEGGERFDLSTFAGRYAKMLSNNDPSTLLIPSEKVKEAHEALNNSQKSKYSDEQLWNFKKTAESALHPDTKEVIPLPFRMAGYVLFNGPVCGAMLTATSTTGLLFWNWVNQSQNALVNYFNRNASSEMTNETLLKSYAGAVTAALTVAFGLNLFIRRSFKPDTATKLMKFIAFPSSVVASSSNCFIMRKPEIDTGIELVDIDGKVLADGKKSVAAAKKAVYETVFSRSMLQFPVFLGPALIMSLPVISKVTKKRPWTNIPLMTFITMVCFSFGLPATIAIFPQQGKIEVSKLEKEFESLGNTSEYVYYNKGL